MKKVLTVLLICLTVCCVTASAQTPLEGKQLKKAVSSIVSSYSNWDTVGLDGKLKSDKLPVTASLKIFMVHDSLIDVSVRAPFLGEVARVVAERDSILVVNKLKRCYACEPFETIRRYAPFCLSDLQSLLLGRIFLAGEGELSANNADNSLICKLSDGGFMVLPISVNDMSMNYGFVADAEGLTSAVMAVAEIGEDGDTTCATVQYTYESKEYKMDIELETKGIRLNGLATFKSPDYKSKPISPFKLDSSYKCVSLRNAIKF